MSPHRSPQPFVPPLFPLSLLHRKIPRPSRLTAILRQPSPGTAADGSHIEMANADRSYRLLIVDNDETDRRFYGKLLSGQPHGVSEIRQAADGAAGLAALRAQVPDCLLLDFSLPDQTGLEFLTNAAVDGVLPCAVVMITGAGSEATAVAAMKLGVQDYLVKDQVNARNLWSAIANAVAQAQLRQHLDGSLRQSIAA